MTVDINLLKKYFPELDEIQEAQFAALRNLYGDWNSKINVISRKDIDNLYLHHVLHSMAIAMFTRFSDDTYVLDLGTGGGFPAIPLAIFFPEVQFHAVDARKKKILVVNEIAHALELDNIKAEHVRAEDLRARQYDYVISRAVAQIDVLWQWSERLIRDKQQNIMPNGLIALKGGDIQTEIKKLPRGSYVDHEEISDYFEEEYFREKHVVYVQY